MEQTFLSFSYRKKAYVVMVYILFLSIQITCYAMMINVKIGELHLFSTWVNTGCQIMVVPWNSLTQMVSF